MMDIYQKFAPRTRRGRKRSAALQLQIFWLVQHYMQLLARLQSRQRRLGLRDSSTVDWWRGPPHERAARMVAKRFGRNRDYRAVHNLVSKNRWAQLP